MFAPGLPSKTEKHPIPEIKEPTQFEFGLHEHHAEKAGKHFDLRLGDRSTGHAHSWAMRYWPEPGEVRLAVQQPTHTVSYMDFKGVIESGYGKGKVDLARRDKTEVLSASKDHVRFNLYPGRGVEEYLLRRTAGDKWMLHNVTGTRPEAVPASKPKYKTKTPDSLNLEDPNTVLQAKIDGAHVLYQFKEPGSQTRVFSYRPSKTLPAIEHTQRLPDFYKQKTPSALKDTVLRGELYAQNQEGKALPPERIGGILNAGVWKSRDKQSTEGKLVPVIFDVVRWKGKNVENAPFSEKHEMLEQAVKAAPWLRIPRTATTPEEKKKLFSDVDLGKEPSTIEGVIEWHKDKAIPTKAKFRPEQDAFVRSVFMEQSQRGMAGGFSYSTTKDGPIAGRVGTGMSHALKRDMGQHPEKYQGLQARIAVTRGHAGRAPAFQAWHLDQEFPEGVKMAEPNLDDFLANLREKTAEACKEALLERLVRLGATDIPGTPRLFMKHRSPEELASLQQGVTNAFQKFEEPAKKAVHGMIDKIPHAGAQRVLKGGANALIENPEMLPISAVPVPGASVAYLAAKRGLEKGLDRLSPLPKVAFSTNAFSGPMNPVIETGASFQPGFKVPSLRAPVQQKTAEEFKLQGHTTFQGLGIAIENRKGSVRSGVDKDGKPWRTVMKLPYGYIKGTKGADGEEVDAYVGPKKDATHAFVVHQKKENGKYDEDKVMLGQPSVEAARKAYLAHYNTDKFLGPIKAVPMERFKQLVESAKKLTKISQVVSISDFSILAKDYAQRIKAAASSPTRGGFLLASDIPQFKSPSLRAPVEKNGDMLPDYVSVEDGPSFKRSKYASVLKKHQEETQRAILSHLDLLKADEPQDRGEIVREESDSPIKVADISPTQPLGDGGGNPHRAHSWLASPKVNSLAAPLNKVAEPMGDFAAAYWGGPGAAGRGAVNEAGFRQASDQNGPPVNSLRAPVRKLASLIPGSAMAAKNVGTKPMMSGGPGMSIADQVKPKGMKFGGPLPGANKTTIGGYTPPSLK